jgi:beta-phosphoglucomutase-like phosphatase (HAD superfamily)
MVGLKALIWDLDGTLAETEDWTYAVLKIPDKMGLR